MASALSMRCQASLGIAVVPRYHKSALACSLWPEWQRKIWESLEK